MKPGHTLDIQARQLALAPTHQRFELASALHAQAVSLGVYPASIRPVYQAMGRGELEPITVPAFNVRGLTYSLGRAIWRTAIDLHAGPFMFELAPSEASACNQTFEECVALVLAAAAREGYRGPVFLQGDHFGIESPEALISVLDLARRVIQAGFYQIDIDASHLFDPLCEDLAGFHRPNAQATAHLIAELRSSPHGARLTLGGEVGEIGGRNTSVSDLQAYHQELSQYLPAGVAALDKISAQTGTTHGGIINPDGTVDRMPLDLDLAAALSRQARVLGWAGLVQHGASTLSLPDLAQLPGAGVVEVHLATQIQNIVFDHPAFPPALLDQMRAKLVLSDRGAEGEQVQEESELSYAQRFYRARWAAWGIFKTELLDLPEETMQPIAQTLGAWVADIFQALQVAGRADLLSGITGEAA
jgi:fructose/tagatose bisphosphate aldolase